MTDYRLKTEKSKTSERKDKFTNKAKISGINETKQGLVSRNQESDGLVSEFRKVTNKYRPDVTVKDPSTFAFFGSAEKYYEDCFYNVINYYPYDGTKKEILEWYQNAPNIDVGILQNHWPSYVGHVVLDEDEFVSFYAGPQSITESSYTGKFTKGETGLTLNPQKGNTVEFWLKKDNWSSSQEVVFDVGTYPGKVAASSSGQFKLYLSNSSGSPLYLDYTLGTLGVSNQNIGSSQVSTSSVGDGAWHHYALKVHQEDSTLHAKLYIDGEFDSSTTMSVSPMSTIDTYMGGCLGADQGSSSGSLSASLDDFRFWKGQRTAKQISRFFDQKIFASETTEDTYDTRLGLYYRFNKPAISVTERDKLVLDYSGNDITGLINNYNENVRIQQSAITVSSVSKNSELSDPSLDAENPAVKTKKQELLRIGQSYDENNTSAMKNLVPRWMMDTGNGDLSEKDSEISTLFHLISSEFDNIKMYLNSILTEKSPRYQSVSQEITSYEDQDDLELSSSFRANNFFIGCDEEDKIYVPTLGSHADAAATKLEDLGIRVFDPPLINAEIDEELDALIEHVSITKPIEEVRRSILENVYTSARHVLKRKGSERSFDPILSSYGVDRNLISYNVYGRNTETFIDNTKVDAVPEERNSLYFGQNLNSTVFLSSSDSAERTFLEGDSKETEYTFEGTFIFPKRRDFDHEISISSVFGISEVSASNNDLTTTSPNNADFKIKVVKDSIESDDAKFVLFSDSGIISDLESDVIKQVYENSRWNLAIRVSKDADNKFVSASAPSYKIEFVGNNHILDNLENSFTLSESLTQAEYESFRSANKTVFLGASRTNITGSVTTQTDIKVIDFNAWNDGLTNAELQMRSKSPLSSNRAKQHSYRDNYDTESVLMSENKILSIQFDALSELSSNSDITIADASSGSLDQIIKYGDLIGNKYPARSTVFASNLDNVIQREFLPTVRNIPLGNLHGEDGVEVKSSEINKFDLSSRPESKLFSFEKSMYQSISREMVSFLGGMTTLNNLIGEPVYNYRKNYKMLEHLRHKFYETVESENQFERFVSYFRWIDKSIGNFLEQLVPATATTNTGIEDVIESHVLERNKYDHKAPLVERKEYDNGIESNLLSINELLYDWEHGHFASDDDDHCLWQKDREERTGDRETLRKVLTTVVSGSTYVLRNLVKPYKHTVDKQTLLNIGSNRNANKNRELYKIVNEGKEITIDSEDIYEFKSCNDEISPQEEKIYTAKTNTTSTDGYLDADADMILPFTLYSASVGEDFDNFKSNLKITNNHDSTPALQSPFIKQLVGGMPHRNVRFGTADQDRPEAYDISSSATTLTVKQTTAPKSMFHRDLAGSRFYHIGNVKTTETPLVFGNYSKEYEIIMTNARSLNNNYLVENEGAGLTGGIVSSIFVSESTDFTVPERPARDHVIVNRFSAPGSPESTSPHGLDRESAELSVYNTVNYRNALVRNVENQLSIEPSEKFGYRSGSSTQASKHMTNRNPRNFTGSLGQEESFDNNFVQHQIPRDDFGYAWVTASANESVYSFVNKNENAGHQHLYNISGNLKSSETINFVSASEINSNIDFVNLNTNTTRSLTISSNSLTNNSQDLNTIILNRQGPSGWPSWKQTRGEQHPVAKAHKKNNKLSIVYRTRNSKKYAFVDSIKGDYDFNYGDTTDNDELNTSSRQVENYDEVFISSKFNPLNVNLTRFDTSRVSTENLDRAARIHASMPRSELNQGSQHLMWFNDEFYISSVARASDEFRSGISNDEEDTFVFLDGPESVVPEEIQGQLADALNVLREAGAVSMRSSIQNKITGFAQRKLESLVIGGKVENGDIWSKYVDEEKFNSQSNLAVLKNYLQQGTQSGLMRELNYIETIYPREINTYTNNVRTRQNFDFFGWDSTRANRNLILSGNVSYGTALVSSSSGASQGMFFPASPVSGEKHFKTSYYGNIDMVDVNSTASNVTPASSTYITASKWVLDSRQTFSALPLNLTSSFFTEGESFLNSRSQGTRGEGVLQNDYSIFPMGYNGLRGAPPVSAVYNRRIPQAYGDDVFLSGEAKFESADNRTGPFFNTYEEYARDLRSVGQTYSIIPEYRISEHFEDTINSKDLSDLAPDNFLQLTGAIYHSSSGDLSVGTQFFETYSMTDFMKYFKPVRENMESSTVGLAAGRLTLRCQATKRFLPYRGFYPAERVVQISEIFERDYLKDGTYSVEYLENNSISKQDAENYFNLRIQNAKAQAIKPILAPGVLLNSIKTGIAVDYPIFSSSVSSGVDYIFNNIVTSSLNDYSSLSLGPSTSFTGSLVNSSVDEGIPRISGSVETRITFEDLLNPGRIWDKIIYDNEPHPSASMMYGVADHLKVLDRPTKFGSMNADDSKKFGAMSFETSKSEFQRSMLPFRSAVNNFCAETVNFFLEDGKLQTAVSSPEPQLFATDTYSMRVYLVNEDTVMYDRHSAFGPPVDEGDLEITTYQISSSFIDEAAATASLGFASISAPYPDLSGSTVTIENTSGTSKTFKFKTEVLEATASANILYNSNPSGAGVPTLQMSASYEGDADDSKVWSKFSFYNYQFSGSISAQQVVHYDPADFTTSVAKFKFHDFPKYSTQIKNFLGSGSNGPRLEISGSGGVHLVRFYDSNQSTSGVGSNSAVLSYLDVHDGSSYKSQEQLAIDFSALFQNSNNLSSSFVAISGTGSSNSNRVHIFSRSRSSDSDVSISATNHTGSFTHYDVASTAFIARITTGSSDFVANPNVYGFDDYLMQAWYHNTSLDGYVQASVSWPDTVTSINNPLVTFPYKFADVGSSTTGDDLVTDAAAAINGFLPSRNISASSGTSNELLIHRRDAGTQGNHTPGHNSFIGPSVLTRSSIVASNTSFAGGINGETFTNASLDGTDVVISVGSTATLSNVISSASAALTDVTNGLGSTVATNSTSTNLHITQSTAGIAGNNTITESGFVSGGGTVSGFAGGVDYEGGVTILDPTTAVQSSSHGFLPYVPPFLDPNTSPYAELSFTPTTEREYTIPEVLENLQITYYNMPAPSNSSTNINYQEAMVLSASINFRSHIKLRSDHESTFSAGKAISDPTTSDLYRWIIQPKWETPIVDFSNVTSSALNLSDNSVQQVSGSPWKTRYQSNYYEVINSSSVPYLTASTGMWHQSGNMLSDLVDKGYYMVIESGDLANSSDYSARDLATKVGFLSSKEDRKRFKLGQIAETKSVYEAVIAIPFYNDPEDGIKFFSLNEEATLQASRVNSDAELDFSNRINRDTLSDFQRDTLKNAYMSFYNSPGIGSVENIAYQLRMMEKFIVPPQFDFVSKYGLCSKENPFVQYIFQFHTEFTRSDLASMWQNLYPNSQDSAATAKHSSPFSSNSGATGKHDVEYISNFLDVDKVGMFRTMSSNYANVEEFLESEVRWLVFKAKQRGVSDYEQIVVNSATNGTNRNLLAINGRETDSSRRKGNFDNPGFNWPYDYFSLVELGKLESKVDFYDSTEFTPTPKETGFTTTTSRYTSQEQQQGPAPLQYTAVGTSTSAATTAGTGTADVAQSMVFREVLLEDTQTPSTRVFTVSQGSISSGTEQLYVNGVLQSVGSSNDYTISGNTITFVSDLEDGDTVVVSYVKS